MQFTRVVSLVEEMEIWNASSDGFSFAISNETAPAGVNRASDPYTARGTSARMF